MNILKAEDGNGNAEVSIRTLPVSRTTRARKPGFHLGGTEEVNSLPSTRSTNGQSPRPNKKTRVLSKAERKTKPIGLDTECLSRKRTAMVAGLEITTVDESSKDTARENSEPVVMFHLRVQHNICLEVVWGLF